MNHLSLKEQVTFFPDKAGIYQMFDQKKNIIYIGKAKNLRNRVRSYFNPNQPRRITRILISRVVSIDYILTETEQEALILENNLIKKHQPFFNIDLKDHKSYPYLCLTTEDRFPALIKTRILGTKGIFFGPFTNVTLVNIYLEIVHTLYPLKKCRTKNFPQKFKPCLYYHIGQCLDYCTGGVAQPVIDQLNQEIKTLLQGKKQEVIERLRLKMQQESEKQNYEKARNIKHYIDVLIQLETKQAVSLTSRNSFDVIHYSSSDQLLIIVVLQFRNGRLIDKESFNFTGGLFEENLPDAVVIDSLQQFIFDYYSQKRDSIKQLIVPPLFFKEKDFVDSLQSILHSAFTIEKKTFIDEDQPKHPIIIPKVTTVLKGEKKHYLKLAEANAKFSIQETIQKREKLQFAHHLKTILKLSKPPKTIESFDIANTADRHIIAGMVRFENGEKDKKNYRIFNIHSTQGQNDFASIEEAVYRRYKRLLQEEKKFPDLILIDGGKGQLSSAKKSLDRLGIKGQPIIALAKKEEKIYVPKKNEPLSISIEHPALQFLIRVRDETHLFANSRHVQKRTKSDFKSNLLQVQGLGNAKIKTLLEHFNSLEEIKFSSLETLARLPFFGRKDAQRLIDFLQKN